MCSPPKISLAPFFRVVLSARRPDIYGLLRIRAQLSFIIHGFLHRIGTAVAAVFGNNIVRSLAFLDPIRKRSQLVPLVRTPPATAVSHSWNHKQARPRVRGVEIAFERGGYHLPVVVDNHRGIRVTITPALIH